MSTLINFLVWSQLLVLAVCRAQLIIRTSNYSVNLGVKVELTCSVTVQGYDIGRNHTLNTVLSKVNGQPSTLVNITSSSDGATTYNETLILIINSFDDEGEYVCRSAVTNTNDSSELEVKVQSFYVNVLGQTLIAIYPEALNVTVGSNAGFICSTRHLEGVVEWKRDKEIQFGERVMLTNTGINIVSVTYADIGTYTCAVFNNGTQIAETSATLNVTDYRPPFIEGTSGIGLVIVSTSSEQPFVECLISGHPGPSVVYWNRGMTPATDESVRVPRSLNESETGPVVDTQGRLDLTQATEDDSGFYTCTGVDVTGANATQTINIRVEEERFVLLWTQWYMILVYCVAGVITVVLIALFIWFCYATRNSWWIPVAKKTRVKQRVKKPKAFSFDDFGNELYSK